MFPQHIMQAKLSCDRSYLFFNFKIRMLNQKQMNQFKDNFFLSSSTISSILQVIFILLQYATTVNDPSFQDLS